jgi:hypothetical protein
MMQRSPRSESPASAKGAARKRARDEETMTPMDKFRSLARRLVGVSRQELAEQERKYREERDEKRKRHS